eukprot:UN04194
MQKLLLAIAATAVLTTTSGVNALGDVERSQWRGAIDGHVSTRGQTGINQEHTMEHKHINLRRKNHPHVLEEQENNNDKIYETPVLIKQPETTIVRTLASIKNEIDNNNNNDKHQHRMRRGQLLDKRKELKEQMWREQPEVEIYKGQIDDKVNFEQNEYIKIDPKDKVFKVKPLQAVDDEAVPTDDTIPAPVDETTTPTDETVPTPTDETTTPIDNKEENGETTPTDDKKEDSDAEKPTEEEEKEDGDAEKPVEEEKEETGDDVEKEEDKNKHDDEEEKEEESSSSSSSSGDSDDKEEEEHSADGKKDKHNKEEEEKSE